MSEIPVNEALTVSEIRQILKIGANSAYNLIHSKAFPVKKVGHSYRIPTGPFVNWLEGHGIEPALPGSTNPSHGAAAQS